MDPGLALQVAFAALAITFIGVMLWRRARRDVAGAAALAHSIEQNRHIPASLHPVIDTDICIGSLSCLKACPEGDILGVIEGAARLVHADHCIGHGRCAAECPVNAIKLVFGTAERGVDLPEVDEFFEASRPGVHVVGEMGGMGLIKNAVTQGLQVAERLHEVLPQKPAGGGMVDVAIVGAGPAGLATAAALSKLGHSFRLLEQGTVGGTVAHYPRQKVVMTETVELPFLGKFGKTLIAKEELLASLIKLQEKAKIAVEEGVKVTGLEGEDGAYTLLSEKGKVQARKVVLACGRRGSPRKLGVPGEEGEKVAYRLSDPEQYDGCDVMVVGGGDSALEAAIQLAKESSARVSISYRGDAFARCRERNRDQIAALGAEGRVRVLLGTQVQQIYPRAVRMVASNDKDNVVDIPNDFVIVQAGGELPLEFLKSMGVEMRRYHGEARGEKKGDAKAARQRAGSAKEREEAAASRRATLLYVGTGLIILTWLASVGWDYYILPRAARLHAPGHDTLKSAGHFGHGVGIVATAFMLSNFLYPVRKRARALTGVGSIKGWLNFHTFVGFMSPLVIAFHAAFQFNNLLATGTAGALLIVVSTGLIGRFIYGLVPARGGQALELAELRASMTRLEARVRPHLHEAADPTVLEGLLKHALTPDKGGGLFTLAFRLLLMPFDGLALRLRLLRLRGLFHDNEVRKEVRSALLNLERMRVQIGFLAALKALLRTWRLFHASLAVTLVVAIAAHIGVSLYLGYVWIR